MESSLLALKGDFVTILNFYFSTVFMISEADASEIMEIGKRFLFWRTGDNIY